MPASAWCFTAAVFALLHVWLHRRRWGRIDAMPNGVAKLFAVYLHRNRRPWLMFISLGCLVVGIVTGFAGLV